MTLRPPRTFLRCALATALLCTACAPALRTSCGSGDLRLVNAGRLTAGVDLSNPPYGYTDANDGTPTGFEVELVRALAEAMDLKLTLLNRGAPTLVPAALAHRVDIGAASFRDEGAAPADVCRSAPYLDADLAVVVNASALPPIEGVDDLADRTVAVVRNSPGSRWAAENLSGSSIRAVVTSDDAFAAVRSGSVSAAVVDRPVALRTERAFPEVKAVETVVTEAHYVFLGAEDAAVMTPVDAGIAQLQSNGTLDELKRKWFGPGV